MDVLDGGKVVASLQKLRLFQESVPTPADGGRVLQRLQRELLRFVKFLCHVGLGPLHRYLGTRKLSKRFLLDQGHVL